MIKNPTLILIPLIILLSFTAIAQFSEEPNSTADEVIPELFDEESQLIDIDAIDNESMIADKNVTEAMKGDDEEEILEAAAESEEEILTPDGLDAEDLECAAKFECKVAEGNQVWYDCYYGDDEQCHCFKGLFSYCREEYAVPDEIDAEMSKVSEKDKNVLVYWIGFGAALIIALIIIFLILSGMPRSTIEKAKHYHKLGEDAYNRGDIEQADEYYDLARKHRERAKKS